MTLAYPPGYAWGGPVKNVQRVCRELVKRGHEVTVYSSNLLNKRQKIREGTLTQEIEGVRVVYLETKNLPWWPGTLGPAWMPELGRRLRREISAFDVVHLHGYRSLFLAQAARAATRAGVPYVVQPRGTLPVIINTFALKRLYDMIFRRVELGGLSALIALQSEERRQAIAKGVPGGRIVILPNGIDEEEREKFPARGSFRRRFGLNDEERLILYVGRINEKKGVDMLVEALAQMDEVEAKLAIVGPDDGALGEVQSLIRRYGLGERVILAGLLAGEEVYGAYQDADLLALPCRMDTFPTVIMEACLAELPMVITEGCEMAELVKDRVAEVTPFDARRFAQAMETLLLDRKRYARYRANCQKILKDTFSLKAVVDRLEEVYRQAASEKRREG